jgi:hypothetical protein
MNTVINIKNPSKGAIAFIKQQIAEKKARQDKAIAAFKGAMKKNAKVEANPAR